MDVHEAVQCVLEALQARERLLAEQGEKLTLEGDERRAALEAEYQTRAKTLENREKAIADIRGLAADRLAELKTVKQALEDCNQKRREAEAKQRAAEKEKARLESVVADLIKEKQAREVTT